MDTFDEFNELSSRGHGGQPEQLSNLLPFLPESLPENEVLTLKSTPFIHPTVLTGVPNLPNINVNNVENVNLEEISSFELKRTLFLAEGSSLEDSVGIWGEKFSPSTKEMRVSEAQFPDQSIYTLEKQLLHLKKSMGRLNFYLTDLIDLIPHP